LRSGRSRTEGNDGVPIAPVLVAFRHLARRALPGELGRGAAHGAQQDSIRALFHHDAGLDAAKATFAQVNEAIAHVKGLESFLDSTLGSGKGVNFQSLNKLLGEMKHAIEPYAVVDTPIVDAADGSVRPAAKGVAVMSGIQTRADVIKALELICDYYRGNEPSSPVPLILQRAQRLVDKDFITIMTDLTPDALKQLAREIDASIRFYEAFALFKVAGVIQQLFARYARGETKDRRYARFDVRVAYLAERAAGLPEGVRGTEIARRDVRDGSARVPVGLYRGVRGS
jgi:hypothetical protein